MFLNIFFPTETSERLSLCHFFGYFKNNSSLPIKLFSDLYIWTGFYEGNILASIKDGRVQGIPKINTNYYFQTVIIQVHARRNKHRIKGFVCMWYFI